MVKRIEKRLRRVLYRCLSGNFLGTKKPYKCNICDSDIYRLCEGGINATLFNTRHVIGGGIRENCVCPVCGAIDRTRWCYYVLKHYTKLFSDACAVLHFAPEKSLEHLIEKNGSCEYYTADINPRIAKYKVDITNIQFEDNMFDYVIVNHVLEHIPDEGKAISELKRVLKDEGKIILSFPVCTDIDETLDDDTVKTPAERLEKFGQEDHVRLYGLDVKKRLEGYGLIVKQLSPKDILSVSEIERYGLIPDDIMFVCEKQH